MIDRGGSRGLPSAVGYPQGRWPGKARLGRTPATIVHPMAWAVLCGLCPAGHASSPRTRPASGTGRTRPGPPDPRAALVDGPAVRPRGVRPQLLQKALALLPPHQAVVGPGHAPPGALGGLACRQRGRRVHAADRPGRPRASLAQRPMPGHDDRAHPVAVRRLSTWGCAGAWACGPRLSACGLGPRRHGGPGLSVRRRFSDWVRGGRVCDGRGHWAAGRLVDGQRPAAARGRGRPDQPLVPG